MSDALGPAREGTCWRGETDSRGPVPMGPVGVRSRPASPRHPESRPCSDHPLVVGHHRPKVGAEEAGRGQVDGVKRCRRVGHQGQWLGRGEGIGVGHRHGDRGRSDPCRGAGNGPGRGVEAEGDRQPSGGDRPGVQVVPPSVVEEMPGWSRCRSERWRTRSSPRSIRPGRRSWRPRWHRHRCSPPLRGTGWCGRRPRSSQT